MWKLEHQCKSLDGVRKIDFKYVQSVEFNIFEFSGRIETGVNLSDDLMKAIVPYVTTKDCADRFISLNVPVYSSYLCAGGKTKIDTSVLFLEFKDYILNNL